MGGYLKTNLHCGKGKCYVITIQMMACQVDLNGSGKARATSQVKVQASGGGKKCHGARVPKFCDLPNPDGRYVGLINAHGDLADASVVSPDIRDGQGVLITPGEYNEKIKQDEHVEVEVCLKLWNIQLNPRSNSQNQNQNGSRIYQVILKSMKLLPFHSYTQVGLLKAQTQLTPANKKGKRKAGDDDGLTGQSPSKKASVIEPEPVFDMDLGEI